MRHPSEQTTHLEGAETQRFQDVYASEILKISGRRLGFLLAALSGTLALALAVAALADIARVPIDGVLVPLGEIGSLQLAPVYGFVFIGALANGDEYIRGQVRVTLSAVPHRWRLGWAKLAAVLTVSAAAAVCCVVPVRVVLGLGGDTAALEIVTECGRWVVVYVLLTALGFGLAGIFRSTAIAVGALVIMPALVVAGIIRSVEVIRMMPHQLALAFLGLPDGTTASVTPSGAFGALLLMGAVVSLLYVILLVRRDA